MSELQRLTHERSNGIKSGYWSQYKKDDLINRLAGYENTGLTPDEIMQMKSEYKSMSASTDKSGHCDKCGGCCADALPAEQAAAAQLDLSKVLVDDLGISNRCFYLLKRYGLRTVAEIAAIPPQRLLNFRGMGRKTMKELADVLKGYGVNINLADLYDR